MKLSKWNIILITTVIFLTACGLTEKNERQEAGMSSELTTQTAEDESNTANAVEMVESSLPGSDDKEDEKNNILKSLEMDWQEGTINLVQVQKLLDESNLQYEGRFNWFRDRVDIQLDDGTNLVFLKADTEEIINLSDYILIMSGDIFNEKEFNDSYLQVYGDLSSQEFYPETAEGILSEDMLNNMSQTKLSIARNEIYARHGRTFNDEFLSAVFMAKEWYQPLYSATEFAAMESDMLNSYEKENLRLLIEREQQCGFRQQVGQQYERPIQVLSGSWIDFDSDGTKEQFIYTVEPVAGNSSYNYIIHVNNGLSVKSLDCILYTASLDGTKIQVLEGARYINSENGNTDVYQYSKGEMKQIGRIPGVPSDLEIEKDGFFVYSQIDHLQSRIAKLRYELKHDVFTEVAREFYEHGNEVSALLDIPLYLDKEDSEIGIVIPSGETVTILGGDNKEWIYIERNNTKEKGWIKVIGCSCILPDGSQIGADELFEGLTYFG